MGCGLTMRLFFGVAGEKGSSLRFAKSFLNAQETPAIAAFVPPTHHAHSPTINTVITHPMPPRLKHGLL